MVRTVNATLSVGCDVHTPLLLMLMEFQEEKTMPNRTGRCCLYGLTLLHLIPNTVLSDDFLDEICIAPFRCGISNRFAAFLDTGVCLT